jgi:16S rRNA C1402 N4-methylase RsmH
LAHSGREVSLPQGGSRWEGILPRGRVINKKPVVPEEGEVKVNPRSRSAKLRIFERI